MTRKTLWSSLNGDIPANLAFTNNFEATSNPTASNDTSQGYSVGSVWVNTTTGQAFTCTKSTAGAAVWVSGSQSQGLGNQAAPIALTVSAVVTPAQLLVGLLTSNQGAGAAASYQLPLADDLDAALPTAGVNSYFDFSLINISVTTAEVATITTNTGWSLAGSMVVASNQAAANKSSGRFRARKTGTGAWTLYRLA